MVTECLASDAIGYLFLSVFRARSVRHISCKKKNCVHDYSSIWLPTRAPSGLASPMLLGTEKDPERKPSYLVIEAGVYAIVFLYVDLSKTAVSVG